MHIGLDNTDGTRHLEGNADSWNRTAAICRISVNLTREGGRGPCLGALGVCGLEIHFPSPLLRVSNSSVILETEFHESHMKGKYRTIEEIKMYTSRKANDQLDEESLFLASLGEFYQAWCN